MNKYVTEGETLKSPKTGLRAAMAKEILYMWSPLKYYHLSP